MSVATSTAIGIAGGLAAAGSVTSAVLGSKAAGKQADASLQASSEANAIQERQYEQNRADLAPYRDQGYKSLAQLGTDTAPGGRLDHNFGAADFTTDPGYQFRLDEGKKALERGAAAKGTLFSGGTLKAEDRYNQDFASNEYNNAYNRYQADRNTTFNQEATLAGLGQNALNTTVAAGTNTANQVANNTVQGITGAANARASGYASIANGINGGTNSLSQMLLLSQMKGVFK